MELARSKVLELGHSKLLELGHSKVLELVCSKVLELVCSKVLELGHSKELVLVCSKELVLVCSRLGLAHSKLLLARSMSWPCGRIASDGLAGSMLGQVLDNIVVLARSSCHPSFQTILLLPRWTMQNRMR